LLWNTATRRVEENQEGLKMNRTLQPLAYAYDNVVEENKDNIKENTGALLDTGKEVGAQLNPEKTKYMLKSPSQKIRQKHTVNLAIRAFEDVGKSRYLGTRVTDQNCMHGEIKRRLNSGNACYHSVQSLLSSYLLSRNIKVKIYKTIILPVVLHGCETWSLTLREGQRLRVFENRVLRRIFGPKRDELTGKWRKLQNGEFHNLYSSPDIIRQVKSRRMRLAGHAARMGEVRKVCRALMRKPEGKCPLERPRRRWEAGVKMDLREIVCGGWGVDSPGSG
jgi:hypothetical protein